MNSSRSNALSEKQTNQTKQFYLEEFSLVNLKNIFKKIQIHVDAKIWGEKNKRIHAKMLLTWFSSLLQSYYHSYWLLPQDYFYLIVDLVHPLCPGSGLDLDSWPQKTLFGIKIFLASEPYVSGYA